MIKLVLLSFLLFNLFAQKIELADIAGISFKELIKKDVVTYNPKTNELKKISYYIKDAQLYKTEDLLIIYPSNTIKDSRRILQYKTALKEINCNSLKVKDCINSLLPTKAYFKNEDQKIYILPENKAGFYNIIKYNTNIFP